MRIQLESKVAGAIGAGEREIDRPLLLNRIARTIANAFFFNSLKILWIYQLAEKLFPPEMVKR